MAIIAPCHLAFEVTSVIWNHVSCREISAAAGQMAFETFLAQEIELDHPADLEVRAWILAQQYNRPTAYDAESLLAHHLLDPADLAQGFVA